MKIGKIKYLNCLPYYSGWDKKEFQFEEGTPAQINQWMRTGVIDAAPISSMEYLQNPEEYFLFPDLGIASGEYVRSVTLFSKKKIEDLKDVTIAVTEESLTSTHLLDLLLRGRFDIQAKLESRPSNPKEMLKNYEAALLIGNDALFAQPKKWLYRYDLGNLWWQWQKLPFVFAIWVVRRESTSTEAVVADFYHTLKERFLYNSENLHGCIQQHCSIDEFDKLYPKVHGYLKGLRYQIDDLGWQGFRKFAELCEAQGFCGKPNWERVSFGSVPVSSMGSGLRPTAATN